MDKTEKTLTARKAKLLRLFHCALCHDGVKHTRVCPRCSRFFCNKCIQNWLQTSKTCPNCRAAIASPDSLVKGSSITEMQESMAQLLAFLDDDLCGQHEQNLNLYCYFCEVNICIKCWFSTDHMDHKEQVVPIEDAYEHYTQTLKTSLVWANGRRKIILDGLKKVAEAKQQLNSQLKQIGDVCDESKELLAGEASSGGIIKVRNLVETITEHRSKDDQDTDAIRVDRRWDFMLEPTVVVFCFPEVSKHKRHVGNSRDSNGLEWKCLITEYSQGNVDDDDVEEEYDEEDGADQDGADQDGADEDGADEDACGENAGDERDGYEEDQRSCFLSLIDGPPGDYSVAFGNEPEKVLSFELNKKVLIGYLGSDSSDENDSCRVTVEIRQTYADRIKHLQEENRELRDKNAELEKQHAKQKSFKTLLSDYEKIMGTSSD